SWTAWPVPRLPFVVRLVRAGPLPEFEQQLRRGGRLIDGLSTDWNWDPSGSRAPAGDRPSCGALHHHSGRHWRWEQPGHPPEQTYGRHGLVRLPRTWSQVSALRRTVG